MDHEDDEGEDFGRVIDARIEYIFHRGKRGTPQGYLYRLQVFEQHGIGVFEERVCFDGQRLDDAIASFFRAVLSERYSGWRYRLIVDGVGTFNGTVDELEDR